VEVLTSEHWGFIGWPKKHLYIRISLERVLEKMNVKEDFKFQRAL
jgi:hypothetical protein